MNTNTHLPGQQQQQQQQQPQLTPIGPNTFRYYDTSAVHPANHAKIHRIIVVARTILIRSNLLLENLSGPVDFASLFNPTNSSDPPPRPGVFPTSTSFEEKKKKKKNNNNKSIDVSESTSDSTHPDPDPDPADPGDTLSISLSLETHVHATVKAQADAEHTRRLFDSEVEHLEPTLRSQLDATIRATLARIGLMLPGNRRQLRLNGATVLGCILQIEEVITMHETAVQFHLARPQTASTTMHDGFGRPMAAFAATAAAPPGAGTGAGIGASKNTRPVSPKTILPQPDPYHDTLVIHVATGCNLAGEMTHIQTINLPPDIDWLDFERALSDTTANTRQAVEAGFPCGYVVTYDSSSHRNGGGDGDDNDEEDDDEEQRYSWLWIYKGPRQQASLRTPYRRLRSREEFKELKDVYWWEKTLERMRWQAQGFRDATFEGLIVLHSITHQTMQSHSRRAQSLLDRRSTGNPEDEPSRAEVIAQMHMAFGPGSGSGFAMDEGYGYQGIGGGDSDSSEMDLNLGADDDDDDDDGYGYGYGYDVDDGDVDIQGEGDGEEGFMGGVEDMGYTPERAAQSGSQRQRQRQRRQMKSFFDPGFVWAEYMDTRTR